jgi:hypothetical protein
MFENIRRRHITAKRVVCQKCVDTIARNADVFARKKRIKNPYDK